MARLRGEVGGAGGHRRERRAPTSVGPPARLTPLGRASARPVLLAASARPAKADGGRAGRGAGVQ
jgi:hypothetical protein